MVHLRAAVSSSSWSLFRWRCLATLFGVALVVSTSFHLGVDLGRQQRMATRDRVRTGQPSANPGAGEIQPVAERDWWNECYTGLEWTSSPLHPGVTRVAYDCYEIDGELADELFDNATARGAGPVFHPVHRNFVQTASRLELQPQSTVFQDMGLNNGDIVVAVNGAAAVATNLLPIANQLANAEFLRLDLIRDGLPLHLHYRKR